MGELSGERMLQAHHPGDRHPDRRTDDEMKYRVLRIEGTRGSVERLVTGTPEKGWISQEWVGFHHAKGHAKIASRNHPKLTYEVQNDHYEPVAVYKDGEEI